VVEYARYMQIKLYNTLSRKKEIFKPIHKDKVGLYTCGPTVYWFAHIGNMMAYVVADLLCRTLEYNGLKVKQVMNITDVGHLTSDEDEGEDKMIIAMRREGKSAYDIAGFYTAKFVQDVESLNVKPAFEYPRATDHIPEQIDLVKQLEEKGFTYRTDDGIYFDTSKLKDYGRLSGQAAEEKKAGARVELGQKKNPTDFALWKFSPKDEKREMEWDSPWGVGFPGWHLECSAMSVKYLGIPFDIHTGGVDHIAVHHENEIAQSAGAFDKLQANYWVHNDHITIDNGKMSKSLGNLFLMDDLAKKGFEPLAYRYFVLGAHYRTKHNFTWEVLEAAQNSLNNLRDAVRDWDKPGAGSKKYEKLFQEAVNNDLDLPGALAVVWNMVQDDKVKTADRAASLSKFDQVLGLDLDKYIAKPVKVPGNVKKLVKEREQVRKEKDFKRSDELRDEIAEAGFVVEDTSEGSVLREKH
jgi:cysteinyl-tRNA synthetase